LRFWHHLRVKRAWSILTVAVVLAAAATAGGCGDTADAGDRDDLGATQRTTQGGVSMEPTIMAGQEVTYRAVSGPYRPRHGDIVIFRSPGGKWSPSDSDLLLKRVVAVGGDTVACCDEAGAVTVDGKSLKEPYVADDSPLDAPPNDPGCGSRRFDPVAVPTGHLFLMGDNRGKSYDSRCTGTIPAEAVTGVVSS